MTFNQDDLMRELLQTFHAEAAEHLQKLNQALLKLERQPDSPVRSELLQEAFRSAHSLKGAARAVALKQVESLAHRMEDVLKLAREGKMNLNPDVCDVLYNTLDGIQGILSNREPDVQAILDELNRLLVGQTITPSEDEETSAHDEENNGSVDEGIVEAEVMPVEHDVLLPDMKFNENDATIRVAVNKLDALMAQVGELTATRISAEQRTTDMQVVRHQIGRLPRLWQDVKVRLHKLNRGNEESRDLLDILEQYQEAVHTLTTEISAVDTALTRDSLRLGMVTGRLQDEMRRVRMVPFQTLSALLQRTARDTARSENKQANLIIKGGDVELDKKVLEMLKDPLLHLVRNAVGHGIENADVREKMGKPREGQVVVHVTQRGSEAHIIIHDDGKGFQLDAIRKASEAIKDDRVANTEDIISLAFMAGVTTAQSVTEISGRGVGLDVVRQQVELLQGRISVDNQPNKGAEIQLVVPVSLAMTRVLLVRAGTTQYALPLASVEKIITPNDTFSVEGQIMVMVDGRPLTLVSLTALLDETLQESEFPLVVIMGAAEQRIALLVDDVLTEQELAVKSFSRPLVRVANIAGAALLGNGDPIVVLNTSDLAKSARGMRTQSIQSLVRNEDDTEQKRLEHILVVDDSITTRTLEKNILQAAGYLVETATDGMEALNELRTHEVDLIVADVEMPNMDGISLTRHLRDSEEFGEIPIILVTSLESQEDREKGMRAGANAYIVKRGFNQAELLETIRQFL